MAVGGYNKMHTRQTREWAPPLRRSAAAPATATDNLPAVRLGRRRRREEEENASAAAAHNLLRMSLARARCGRSGGMHACTRFIGSPAMIKMPPRFLATSISPLSQPGLLDRVLQDDTAIVTRESSQTDHICRIEYRQ